MSLLQDVVALASGHQLQVRFRVGPGNHAQAPVATAPIQQAPKVPDIPVERAANNHDINFNPKNTFETFVVGNNNNFAYAAALAVAQSPGKSYNPLFLYGGVGVGKKPLIPSIGKHRRGAET